jgi:Icc-related predicted phosphoesterase
MIVAIISDTHNKHKALEIPECDMIIHAGDFSSRGYAHECRNFLTWFAQLNVQHKVFIAGNHDFLAEDAPEGFRGIIPEGIIYLENELVEIEGLRIYGSPVQPEFCNWAFNRRRGDEIKKYWDKIPDNLDILITHGPPHGVGDFTVRDQINVGCEELLKAVQRTKPVYHIFGHIHEGRSMHSSPDTEFINASCVDERYNLYEEPVFLIEIDKYNYRRNE